MKIPRMLTPHTILTRPVIGRNHLGPVFGQQVEIKHVRVEDKTRMVRTESGSEAVSSANVVMRPQATPPLIGSEVTVWPGTPQQRTTTVLQVAYMHSPPAPTHYRLDLA